MIDSNHFLCGLFSTTQISQYMLYLAIEMASGHDMKLQLKAQLSELDRIDAEVRRTAAMYGIDNLDLDPGHRWWKGTCFRHFVSRKNPDSSIAEKLILLHTNDMIAIFRAAHQWEQKEASILTIQQKITDWKTVCIHQMHLFL